MLVVGHHDVLLLDDSVAPMNANSIIVVHFELVGLIWRLITLQGLELIYKQCVCVSRRQFSVFLFKIFTGQRHEKERGREEAEVSRMDFSALFLEVPDA